MKNLQDLADTMSGKKPLIPETAADALARWDEGDTVFTVEMGGFGPGYEQAIQLLVFEMIRDHINDTRPPYDSDEIKAYSKSFGEKAITPHQ